MLLKVVLLAYSRGITSSRVIETLCRRDVQFMALFKRLRESGLKGSYT